MWQRDDESDKKCHLKHQKCETERIVERHTGGIEGLSFSAFVAGSNNGTKLNLYQFSFLKFNAGGGSGNKKKRKCSGGRLNSRLSRHVVKTQVHAGRRCPVPVCLCDIRAHTSWLVLDSRLLQDKLV